MEEEILQKYIQAGKIAKEAVKESKKIIKPGITLLEIADKIEALIREMGGQPAFPLNLSLNDLAAHYTPTAKDQTIFTDKDILKVDCGVHINGYIADTAYTVSFNPDHTGLIKASEEALDAALDLVRPGAHIRKISAAIEDVIKSHELNPIENLTGHGLEKYIQHTEPAIPNIRIEGNAKLEEDQVIAIEPFATSGRGLIKESSAQIMIFVLENVRPVRSQAARNVLNYIVENFATLPFAQRWIENGLKLSEFQTRLALKELRDNGIIGEYPALKEISSGLVSQHEHTIIVKDDPIITTR